MKPSRMISTDRLTLGQLARHVGLARSSVLHYESLGLLTPRGRSPSGYRLYGPAELDRLLAIRRLRDSGLPLIDIGAILSPASEAGLHNGPGPVALLEKRLLDLCRDVERIREQQRRLAHLLAVPEFRNSRRQWNKATWVALLRRAGFDDEAMHQWHLEFERENPKAHALFLKSLGLSTVEVTKIRRWSKPTPNSS